MPSTAVSPLSPTLTLTILSVAYAVPPVTVAVTLTVAVAASSAIVDLSTDSVMPPGASSSSVMLKVAVPEPEAPPPRLAPELAFKAPRPTVTDSVTPSSVVSAVAVRMTVALSAAPFTPEKEIVGGLAVRSVLARFE